MLESYCFASFLRLSEKIELFKLLPNCKGGVQRNFAAFVSTLSEVGSTHFECSRDCPIDMEMRWMLGGFPTFSLISNSFCCVNTVNSASRSARSPAALSSLVLSFSLV